MNANLRDLIAALPQEQSESAFDTAELAREQLQEIFADLARRPMPTGSLHRLWTMSELSTQVALAYAALWVRQWFSKADRRRQQLVETNLRVALKMVHHLGYLRGAATKLGQLLGNLPEVLPDQVVQTLDRLHFEAPPMHFSLLREMVRNELGKDPEDLFARFDKEALAAASIGQVHRARLKSGDEVIVKIQYPAIARTIESDLRNLNALMFPARLGKDWEYTRAQFEAIQKMLSQEADYENEAANMRAARKLFRPEDGVVVPQVHDALSTKRVLTMEYLPGLHLNGFLATRPGQAARNNAGAAIYKAWARMYYADMNYADPHSGNYLFMPDGRLGLLDFGCIEHYDAEAREILRMSEELAEKPERLPIVLRRCGVTEKQIRNPEFLKVMRESVNWIVEPVKSDDPFDFSDETHLRRGVDILSRIVLKRYTRGHPIFVYWNRSIIGIRALMYALRARVNMRSIFESEKKHLV